jgi:amino acid transporter
VIFSCLIIGIFYVLCYYASTVYFGPAKVLGSFYSSNNNDPWTGMAKTVWDWGWIIVFIALVNSSIANANAGANAATRAAYAMARIGLLPRRLAAIDPRRRTPYIAIHVQAIGGIILALILGWLVKGPLNGVGLLGTIATLLVIPIYLLTAISCFTYYWLYRRQEFNVFLHLIVPLIALIFFVPTEVASFGINFAGLGISSLSWPSYYAPWVVLIWVILGIILLVYYMRTRPTRLRETADVYMEEIAAEET